MASTRVVVTSSHDGDDSSVHENTGTDVSNDGSVYILAGNEIKVLQSTSIAPLDRLPARIAGLAGWTIADAGVLQVTCTKVLEELRCFQEPTWRDRTAKEKQLAYDSVRVRMSALQGPDIQQKHWDWLIEDVCHRLYANNRERLRTKERRGKAKRVEKASKGNTPQQPSRTISKPQKMQNFVRDAKHVRLDYRRKTVEQLVTAKMENLLEAGLEPDLAMRLMYKAIQEALPEATHATQKAHCHLQERKAISSHQAVDGRTFRFFKPALRKMAFQHEDQRNSFHAKAEDVASRAYQAVNKAVKAHSNSAAKA